MKIATKVRRMKCPKCGSKDTKKNGKREILPVGFHRQTVRKIQRYFCNACTYSFSKRRDRQRTYTFKFKVEVTRMHIEERMSFRVISKRIGEKYGKRIPPNYLCNMVNEVSSRTKGSIQIKDEFNLSWAEHLVVDDKWINIKGGKRISLIATDSSGDIIHSELLEEYAQDKFDSFFRFVVERLEYSAKSITTDLDEMLAKSIRKEMGSKVFHQLCLRHALERMRAILGYKSLKFKHKALTKRYEKHKLKAMGGDKTEVNNIIEIKDQLDELREEIENQEELLKTIKKMLYYKCRISSEKKLKEIIEKFGREYPRIILFITEHKEGLLTHQKTLGIEKTTNIAENKNRQIMRRLKTIESFQSEETAFNYLNLLRNYLRFKPYTDCRGKRKINNGKSPIEICSGKLKEKDWLRNSLIWSQ